MSKLLIGILLLSAALLEVTGDASVRKGLRDSSLLFIGLGCLLLSGYGIVVNRVQWDFSKLLGVYVSVFAVVSVLYGFFVFKENVPMTTWLGLSLIVVGGFIIQWGQP